MMKIISILLALISIVFFSSTARAEWCVKDYKKVKEDRVMQEYIYGVGKGLQVGNASMQVETRKKLFCPPERIALERSDFIRILDGEIERMEKSQGFEKTQEEFIEVILFMGLKTAFPCK